ncbi:MAG: glycosyltransferase family 2 protein [Gemmataceae bacterium]
MHEATIVRDRVLPEPTDPRIDDWLHLANREPEGNWPATGSIPVSVLIPVKNEQSNLAQCIEPLRWANQIAVVDSRSSDATVPLAQALGAEVYQFHYSSAGWPKKKNWALENIPWRNDWVLIMDADEHMTGPLAWEIVDVVNGKAKPGNGCGDGYYINRRFMFMKRWIRHCGYYPSWNVRLFRHAVGRYERIANLGDTGSGDNEIHEHIVLDTGEPGYLQNDFLHYAYPDLATWIEKHNRYSTWEAHAMQAGDAGQMHASLWAGPIARRRWLKARTRHLPFRPLLRFLYAYLFKGGFLDGYPGYCLCRLLAWYEFVSLAKHREMQRSRA